MRRMDKLVQSLGTTTISELRVSEMARDLDEHVEQFRTRGLDAGNGWGWPVPAAKVASAGSTSTPTATNVNGPAAG